MPLQRISISTCGALSIEASGWKEIPFEAFTGWPSRVIRVQP
jgi:hypothetical protein